jgi:hypothetical protein
MSLSNPTLVNPSTRRFEWSGGKGVLQYYDRETKQNRLQPLPFRFIVLDQLNTIAGFSKQDQSSIWANEVRDLKKDELYTRTKRGPIEAGLYEHLNQTMKRGGKFCKSVYLAYELNGNWVIGNFRAYGSALGAWFDFTKAYSVEQGMVVMTRGAQQEAGTGPYFPPAFSWQKWDEGSFQVAVQLDKQLQVFLSSYLTTPKVDEDGQSTEAMQPASSEVVHPVTQPAATEPDDPAPNDDQHGNDPVIEVDEDESINLDEIPF